MLILRTADADRRSYNGFRYPEFGPVDAPDWDPVPLCGGGLHGLRDGVGDATWLRTDEKAVWQVLEVPDDGPCVDLGGKVKVPRAVVVYSGNREGATAYLDANGCADKPVVFATRSAGDRGTATAGDRGTATAGHSGTATAGDRGTATAGHRGTATAGHGGTATAGYRGTATAGDRGTATTGEDGTATAGYRGTATAGDDGTATAGDDGTATAGHGGTATAGYRGTATAGHGGTATAGDDGTATAGEDGALIIARWDGKAGRYRRSMALVGENGIEPNVPYRLDDDGVFIKVEVPTDRSGS